MIPHFCCKIKTFFFDTFRVMGYNGRKKGECAMISYENGQFSIITGHYAYLFRINAWGLPEQLHFGRPVSPADGAAFALTPGLGWGTSMLLEEGNTGSCPDFLPLEWSGSGRGDYRESPLALTGQSTDFRYESHEIFDGIAPMTGLPQAQGDCQTLKLTLAMPGARLHLYYSAFETALTRRAVLENTGDISLEISKLLSYCIDLPGNYELTSFQGGWIREMRENRSPVTEAKTILDSTTGFSSHRCNPGFLLSAPGATEETGRVYGFNLVYSGNHYASIQRSAQNLTRVVQGISPDNFAWNLGPGEGFETPEAVLAVSEQGFGGLSRAMHQFVNKHIVPKKWQYRSRPIVFNSWEGCMFHFDHGKLLKLARQAKDLGCECFVLDDGWFGARNSDNAGLGDYNVNKKKLPQGLKGLGQALENIGLQFGLWFEPESVNPDSELCRAHPDWVLRDEFEPLLSRHQLHLDLRKKEVRDYIVENVGRTLDGAPISYVKWDMNRHSIALGAAAHEYILGLYEVLGRIFGPRPQILLESCASGGNRFDLGMLCYGPQAWCSDDTDPIERFGIQRSLSYLYPQSVMGAHVSAAPHAQTLRSTPLHTRANVAFFGCLGYELDLGDLLPVEKKEIKAQTVLYKRHRKLFQFGAFHRLEGGFQVYSPEVSIAGKYYGLQPAAPGYEWLQLKALQPERSYRLQAQSQQLRLGQFGTLVGHIAPMHINPNGILLRTADKHLGLPDGEFARTASGAALMAGIPLLPRFRGTGYDKNQRTQADYGSDLFVVIREE